MASRWGILGCGKISSDFTNCLKHNGSQVVACASRTLQSSEAFAKKHKIDKAHGSYQDLFADEDVTIVYIGNVHTHHRLAVEAALRAGKHVLCEKPMGMNSGEVESMLALAKEKGLFLMEGLWTRCFPATRRVAEILRSGDLGKVVSVTADLGFFIPEEVRRLYDLTIGGGGLLDLGLYPISWILLAFDAADFRGSNATATIHREGADMTGTVTLRFGDQGLGTAHYSCRAETQKETHICCEGGSIHVNRCWSAHAPARIVVKRGGSYGLEGGEGEVEEFPLPEFVGNCAMNFGNSEGFVYEARHVEECLEKGLVESPLWTHGETRLLHRVLDDARRQVGVAYPQDKN